MSVVQTCDQQILDYDEELEDALEILEIRASEENEKRNWKTHEEVERDLGLRPL